MSGRIPKNPKLSVPELKEENGLHQSISWSEDEKVVKLYLKHNEEKSRDDEFQESTLVEVSKDKKGKLDKWNIGNEFDNDVKSIIIESVTIKEETDTENAVADELNYDSPSPFQLIAIQQDEVHLKSEEDEKEELNKNTRKPDENRLMLHQCPECSYNTKHEHNLKMHSLRHTKRNELDWYSCPECPYKTCRKGSLTHHAEIHNSNNLILTCSECSFKTRYPSTFKIHMMAHKSDAFKCPNCPYKTGKKYALTKHQLKEHESMDKWHSCPLCPYKTHCKNTLRNHCRQRHNTDPNNPNKIEIFTCTECSYESGCKRVLKQHQLVHNSSKWFQCSHCAFKTPYKCNFKRHLLRHQGDNAEGWRRCPKCSYKAASDSILRSHLVRKHKSSDEIEWFECSQCSYETTYKQNLQRHQLQHKKAHEIKWFCCYDCSFKTKQKSHLVIHISKHKQNIKNKFQSIDKLL